MEKETHRATAFSGCRNLALLRIGTTYAKRKKRRKIDTILRRAGLSLFGSVMTRYSENPEDGYTYICPIGLSGVMIHTYPETGVVTLSLVTCSGEGARDSVKKLCQGLREYFGAERVQSHRPRYLPLR